jgi:hypothetical protein
MGVLSVVKRRRAGFALLGRCAAIHSRDKNLNHLITSVFLHFSVALRVLRGEELCLGGESWRFKLWFLA